MHESTELVPLLRPAIYDGPFLAAAIRVPIAPLLYAYAAEDDGASLRLLGADEASRHGASHAEVVARAIGRLAERETRLVRAADEAPEGLLAVDARDGLEASRILVPGFVASLARDGGRAVCAVPTWTSCFVSTSGSREEVLALAELAEAAWAGSPHGVSPLLYTTNPEGLLVPHAAEDPRVASRLRHLEAAFVATEYERQREAIERGLDGADLVVGGCRVVPDPAGGSATASTFVEGAPCLLPVTDVVFLAWETASEARYVLVRFEDLLAIAPTRLRRVDEHDPPRMATIAFPDTRELEALHGVALAFGSR